MSQKFKTLLAASCAVALTTSCAFKSSVPEMGLGDRPPGPFVNPGSSDPSPVPVAVPIGHLVLEGLEPAGFRAERDLSLSTDLRASSLEWRGVAPATLPSVVPARLKYVIELPGSKTAESTRFVRANLLIRGGRHELVVSLKEAVVRPEGKSVIVIDLSGVSTLLSASQSEEGTLEMEIFSQVERLALVRSALRTPPSRIEIGAVSLKEFSSGANRLPDSLQVLRQARDRLNLIRVLELKNAEEARVSIELPRHPSAVMGQRRTEFLYQDLGCNGAGYSVQSASSWELHSQAVVLLPLNGQILSEWEAYRKSPAEVGTIQVSLEPESVVQVGVYVSGAEIDRWWDQGPLPTTLQQITVPSTCTRVCARQECESSGCHGPMGCPAPGFTVLGCHCIGWEVRREQVAITIGTERGQERLIFPATQTLLRIRYADLDENSDRSIRMAPFVPEDSAVEWSH